MGQWECAPTCSLVFHLRVAQNEPLLLGEITRHPLPFHEVNPFRGQKSFVDLGLTPWDCAAARQVSLGFPAGHLWKRSKKYGILFGGPPARKSPGAQKGTNSNLMLKKGFGRFWSLSPCKPQSLNTQTSVPDVLVGARAEGNTPQVQVLAESMMNRRARFEVVRDLKLFNAIMCVISAREF